MKAYVLLTVEVGKSPEVRDHLSELPGVQAECTAGVRDLVVTIEAEDPKAIGDIVMGEIQPHPSVIETHTLLVIG